MPLQRWKRHQDSTNELSPEELERELRVWRTQIRWMGTWPAFLLAIASATVGGVLLRAGFHLLGGCAAAIGWVVAIVLLITKLRKNAATSNDLLNKNGLLDVS